MKIIRDELHRKLIHWWNGLVFVREKGIYSKIEDFGNFGVRLAFLGTLRKQILIIHLKEETT